MGTSTTSALSLGRVVPAPHTRHLLGPFAATAQNSLLRSSSIVDSLANRQHSCRGSEELAIRKTARFQATPNYFAELRATPSYSEWGAPKNSELLRATPSCSQPFELGSTKLPGNRGSLVLPICELRATPSHSELLRATPSHSEPLRAATRVLRALRAATQSY